MRDRKSSSGRQQGDANRGLRQQSQNINREDRQHGSASDSRKQQQSNRTHRSQQR